MIFSLDEVLQRLPLPATAKWPDGVWDIEVLRSTRLLLEAFAPRGEDHQSPHDRDEVYVIVRGRAVFVDKKSRQACGPGDALFVAAESYHHFEEMTDDFATWVIFAG